MWPDLFRGLTPLQVLPCDSPPCWHAQGHCANSGHDQSRDGNSHPYLRSSSRYPESHLQTEEKEDNIGIMACWRWLSTFLVNNPVFFTYVSCPLSSPVLFFAFFNSSTAPNYLHGVAYLPEGKPKAKTYHFYLCLANGIIFLQKHNICFTCSQNILQFPSFY